MPSLIRPRINEYPYGTLNVLGFCFWQIAQLRMRNDDHPEWLKESWFPACVSHSPVYHY